MPERQGEEDKNFSASAGLAKATDLFRGDTQGGTEPLESEAERAPEAIDIPSLRNKATELQGLSMVQNGLEVSIVGGGLEFMARKFGGDRLLTALQSGTTMAEVVELLEKDEQQRSKLYAAIEKEPMDDLGERMTQTLGGVASGLSPNVENLELVRKREIADIRQGKPTDASSDLLSGDFDGFLKTHPELADGFRASGDILALLKGMRDVYEAEYAEFAPQLERAKADVAQRADEAVAGLRTRLVYPSQRENFTRGIEAARSKAISEMGADGLDRLQAPLPAQPEPIFRSIPQ
jgi:hypothetical protein